MAADLVLLTVPAQVLRALASELPASVRALVIAAKGSRPRPGSG